MTQTKGKTPKLQVEMTDDPRVRQGEAPEVDEPAERIEGADVVDTVASESSAPSVSGSRAERVASWFSRTFPGSEHAVVGGLVGLLAAVMLFVVGVGKTLVVGVMVLVGITLGQCLDGDPKIINYIRHLIDTYRNE